MPKAKKKKKGREGGSKRDSTGSKAITAAGMFSKQKATTSEQVITYEMETRGPLITKLTCNAQPGDRVLKTALLCRAGVGISLLRLLLTK